MVQQVGNTKLYFLVQNWPNFFLGTFINFASFVNIMQKSPPRLLSTFLHTLVLPSKPEVVKMRHNSFTVYEHD